jgi:hypothetical protein
MKWRYSNGDGAAHPQYNENDIENHNVQQEGNTRVSIPQVTAKSSHNSQANKPPMEMESPPKSRDSIQRPFQNLFTSAMESSLWHEETGMPTYSRPEPSVVKLPQSPSTYIDPVTQPMASSHAQRSNNNVMKSYGHDRIELSPAIADTSQGMKTRYHEDKVRKLNDLFNPDHVADRDLSNSTKIGADSGNSEESDMLEEARELKRHLQASNASWKYIHDNTPSQIMETQTQPTSPHHSPKQGGPIRQVESTREWKVKKAPSLSLIPPKRSSMKKASDDAADSPRQQVSFFPPNDDEYA